KRNWRLGTKFSPRTLPHSMRPFRKRIFRRLHRRRKSPRNKRPAPCQTRSNCPGGGLRPFLSSRYLPKSHSIHKFRCSRILLLLLSAHNRPRGGVFMAFCKACGQDTGDATFCPKCGAAQNAAPGGAAVAAPAAASPTAGVDENVAGLLSYLIGWITGLIF